MLSCTQFYVIDATKKKRRADKEAFSPDDAVVCEPSGLIGLDFG